MTPARLAAASRSWLVRDSAALAARGVLQHREPVLALQCQFVGLVLVL